MIYIYFLYLVGNFDDYEEQDGIYNVNLEFLRGILYICRVDILYYNYFVFNV